MSFHIVPQVYFVQSWIVLALVTLLSNGGLEETYSVCLYILSLPLYQAIDVLTISVWTQTNDSWTIMIMELQSRDGKGRTKLI